MKPDSSILKYALVVVAGLMLVTACALGGSQTRYRLIAPQLAVAQSPRPAGVERTLAVERPQADRARDSTHILVRRNRTLLPWPEAVWVDQAPDLVQDLLIEFLDARVATAARYGAMPADHRLNLDLRRFELVERGSALSAEVVVVARLFAASGKLLARTRLAGEEPVEGGSLDAAVAAMEGVLADLFSELARWLEPQLPARAVDASGVADQ